MAGPFNADVVRARLMSITLMTFAALGCSVAPCPEGSTRDGDVCRKHAGASNAGSGQVSAGAAGKGALANNAIGTAGTRASMGTKTAGTSGSVTSSVGTSSAAGVSGSVGASGHASSWFDTAGTFASNTAGTAAVTDAAGQPPKQAPTNAGSVAPPAPPMPQAGSPAITKPPPAGAAGTPASTPTPPQAGEDAPATTPPPATTPDVVNDDWTCVDDPTDPAALSCICVKSSFGGGSNACATPRPTCCYTLPSDALGTDSCVCSPEGSEACTTTGGSPQGVRVGTCPWGP